MARKSRKGTETAHSMGQAITSTEKLYNAAGYIRLSVEDNNKKGDSVETQKAILQNYLLSVPEIKLHDFYIDNGTSGTTFERKAFKTMLGDVENGIINCIIVKDLSRFGRSAIDTGYYIEKYLPSLGCRFIAVNDDFDTDGNTDSGAGVILPLKNIINEAYALDIAKKVKSQLHQSMKSGEYIGPRAPYGYLKAPDNCHKLIVDPKTAPVILKIFEMFAENVSVVNIVRYLNESEILTATQYQREIGLIKSNSLLRDGDWQTFTVNHILSNEIYAGNMVQGKIKKIANKRVKADESEWVRVENTHEAIINSELWAKAQERFKRMADKAASTVINSFTPNIFKGKIFCGHCGKVAQRVRGWKRQGENVYAFSCLSNKQKARNSCFTFLMPEEKMIEILLTVIKTHADIISGKALKLRKNANIIETERQGVKSELAILKQETDKNSRMFKSLYESLVSGLITSDEYREMRENYENKAQDSLSRITELESRQTEFDKQVAEYCELSDLIINADNGSMTEKLIERLVERIRIFSDRSMEIDFSFTSGFELINEVTV